MGEKGREYERRDPNGVLHFGLWKTKTKQFREWNNVVSGKIFLPTFSAGYHDYSQLYFKIIDDDNNDNDNNKNKIKFFEKYLSSCLQWKFSFEKSSELSLLNV